MKSCLLFVCLSLCAFSQGMTIEEYDPKSTLVVPQHPVTRAKYPFIDVHNHQRNPTKDRVDKLVAVYDANRVPGVRMDFYHAYKLIFLCSIAGGEARTSNETSAVDFYDLENLPPLSIYRTNRQMLVEVFAHFADPSRPAKFD